MLAHKISGSKINQFTSKQTTLSPTKLKLDGRVGWDSKLQPNNQTEPAPIPDQVEIQSCRHDDQAHTYEAKDEQLHCPNCENEVHCSSKSLDIKDLDKVIKCRACAKTSKTLHWKCRCRVLWHRCPKHKAIQESQDDKHQPKTRSQVARQQRNTSTRQTCMSFEDLAKQDLERNLLEESRHKINK